MLKFLRKKDVAKKIFLLLALIIIPAFVFWGVGPGAKEKGDSRYIGKIFGRQVDITEFKNTYKTIYIQASLRFGDEFKKVEPFLNISEQAWDRLILLKEAKNRHIKIKNSEVVEFIQEFPLFHNKNNAFDNKIYQHILTYLRTTPRDFEEQIRDTIKIEKLFKEVTDNINLDDKQAFDIYRDKNDKIKIDYISFLIKEYKQKIKFEEKEVREFYDRNSRLFFIPLAINLEYALISSKDSGELEKSIRRNKTDLQKIAKDFNSQSKETGLFNIETIPLDLNLSKEAIQRMAMAKPDQIQIFNTAEGFYIIKLKEKTKDYLLPFNKVKDEVKETFIDLKAKELAKNAADSSLDALKKSSAASEGSFFKTSKMLNLPIQSPKEFTRYDYIPDIGINKNFSQIAFSLDIGKFSDVIETPNGYFITFKKAYIVADEKSFSTQKEKLKQDYLQEKKQKAFDDFFKSLKKHTQLYNLPR